jgi:HEAT repeat protein
MRKDCVVQTLLLLIAGAGLLFLAGRPVVDFLTAWSGGRHMVSWIKDLNSNDQVTRRNAAWRLGNMGPKAGGAVPFLINALRSRDPMARDHIYCCLACGDLAPGVARTALVRIGPAAIPALTKALEDDDPLTRVHAAWALWELEKEPTEVIPILVAAFRDQNAFKADTCVRCRAKEALCAIGKNRPDVVVPFLLKLQKDDDPEISLDAGKVLDDFEQAAGKTAK